MKKTNDELDQGFIKLFKTLTREQKDKVHIVVKWMENASEAEIKEFGILVETDDKKAIEAFVESIKPGMVSI